MTCKVGVNQLHNRHRYESKSVADSSGQNPKMTTRVFLAIHLVHFTLLLYYVKVIKNSDDVNHN